MVPVCNLVAYLLGPVTLIWPSWVAIGLTVSGVMLLRARDQLHALAQTIPGREIITAGEFLVLTGIVLPLLPNEPITKLTTITPFQVWLAVVAVSTLSYGSYLVQKLTPQRGLLLSSLMGGLYSSTAITVVLARQLRQRPAKRAGIPIRDRAGHRHDVSAIGLGHRHLQPAAGRGLGAGTWHLFAAAIGLAISLLVRGAESGSRERANCRRPREIPWN